MTTFFFFTKLHGILHYSFFELRNFMLECIELLFVLFALFFQLCASRLQCGHVVFHFPLRDAKMAGDMVDNFVIMVIQPLALHAEVINVVAPWNFVWVRGSAHHHVVDIAGAAHQIVALFKRAQGSVVYDDRIQFFQQRCCVWGVFCETRFQTNAALALLTWHHVVATISAHHASASSCHVLVVVVFVLGLEFIFTSVFKFGGCSKKSVCGKHTAVVLVFFSHFLLMLELISWPAFIASFVVGIACVTLWGPAAKKVYVFPSPDNVDSLMFRDPANQCVVFHPTPSACPAAKADKSFRVADSHE